jgi:hypothetical protein
MSTQEDRQLDFVLEVMADMARKYRIRIEDQDAEAECAEPDCAPNIGGARSNQSLL